MSPQQQKYSRQIHSIGKMVQIVVQNGSEGLGNAVLCASDYIDESPFLLMFGDHLYKSHVGADACSAQVRYLPLFLCVWSWNK